MSATGQGQAGGDGGGQVSQGEAAQNGQNGAGEGEGGNDFAQALQILQQQGQGQEEMRQQLTQLAQQFQSQQEPEAEAEEPFDWSVLDPSEPSFNPEAMEQLLSERDRKNEERWKSEYVEPLRNDLSELRMSQELQDLATEFPDIGENVDGFMELVNKAADQIGAPQMVNNAGFMRLIRLAAAGAEAAQSEGSEQPDAAHLEGGGGATPAGGSQVDLGDQIVGAAGSGVDKLPW